MSTPARIVLIVLAVVVLLLGGLVGFLLTLDLERYRDDLAALARDTTGLDIRLDGRLGWQFWPSIALSVEDAAADWKDASKEPLVRVGEVRFEAALMPLLSTSPRLEVASILLDRVAVDLRVDAEGRDNWSPPDAGDERPPAPEPDVETDVSANLSLARFELRDLSLRYRDAAAGTDARVEGLTLVGTTRDRDVLDLELGGRARVEEGPSISFDGTASIDGTARRVTLTALAADVVLPDADRPLPIRLDGSLRVGENDDALQVERLAVTVGEAALSASGSITDVQGAGAVALDVALSPTDLRALLTRFGAAPDTADAAAFSRVAGSLKIVGSFTDLRLQPLALEVDALRLNGSARFRAATAGARERVDFDLDADRLDLRPYLPPAPAAASSPDGGPIVSDDALGLEALQTVDAVGTLRASAVVVPDFALGASRLELDLRSGRLQSRLVADQLLGGSADVTVIADGAVAVPTVALVIDAAGLQAGLLAPDAGFDGPLAIRGRLDARGASSAALARSASGRLDLAGTTGTLDVAQLKVGLLQIAQLLGRGEKISAWPDQLRYQSLTGAWTLTQGLTDQGLTLAVDNLRIDARGGLSLDSGDFDFRAGTLFADAAPRSFDVPTEMVGIRLPLRCAGNLGAAGNPCGFDQSAAGELVAQVARSKAGDQVRQRIEERLPEDIRGPASQLLRGLFGAPAAPQAPDGSTESTPSPR